MHEGMVYLFSRFSVLKKKLPTALWLFPVGSFSFIRNCQWYILQWILMLLFTSSQHEDRGLHPLSVSLPLILCSGRGMQWMRTSRNWKTSLMPTNQSCEFLAAISTWRWLFLHHGRCESWNKNKAETKLHKKEHVPCGYTGDYAEAQRSGCWTGCVGSLLGWFAASMARRRAACWHQLRNQVRVFCVTQNEYHFLPAFATTPKQFYSGYLNMRLHITTV